MKAVLWADAVQSLVMVTGIMSVIVVGISKVGGLGEVWRIADEGGRINFWKYVHVTWLKKSGYIEFA